jgi:uncharacterized protein YceK
MLKRLVALLALMVSAVLLSGCVSIQSITSEQQDIVGKLRVTVTICASGANDGPEPGGPNEDHPGCVDLGNSASAAGAAGDPVDSQLLFGMRVPVGASVPDTASATPTPAPPAAGTIVFRRSPSYEAQLQALAPAPAGSRWVGYLSDTYSFSDGPDDTPSQSVPVAVDLGLPRPSDGGPFVGPFALRAVAGVRIVSNEMPAGRAVDCGADLYSPQPPASFIPFVVPQIICIDSPTAAQVTTNFNFQTRDFGVLAGKATASPGQTVTLPFNVRGAGALPAGLTASLSASTALPGAGAVTPSVGSAALSNGSDTRVTVPVAIPKNAGPGVFDVTVTARLDNGQTRTGVAKLTVRDRHKPVLSKLTAKPKRFKAATKKKPKRGTNVSFTLSEPASVRMTVERCAKRKRGRCVRWKALKGGLTQAGAQGANKVRFNGRLRGKALKAGGYRLVLTPKDGAANVGKAARVAFAVRR